MVFVYASLSVSLILIAWFLYKLPKLKIDFISAADFIAVLMVGLLINIFWFIFWPIVYYYFYFINKCSLNNLYTQMFSTFE